MKHFLCSAAIYIVYGIAIAVLTVVAVTFCLWVRDERKRRKEKRDRNGPRLSLDEWAVFGCIVENFAKDNAEEPGWYQ